jgi:hypothetical protein
LLDQVGLGHTGIPHFTGQSVVGLVGNQAISISGSSKTVELAKDW